MAANQLPFEVELAPQAGLNVPNGLIFPNGLNVHEQPAPPTPQPILCKRHRNGFKLLFVSLLIVSFFIGGRLGSRNARRNHRPSSFTCGLVTTVALDGSGNYTSIRRALEMAPRSSHLEYCIYIKSGIYKEDIIINKTQTNMVLIGEGLGKTTVSGGNLSSKATLEVFADGFIAKDIAFESLLGVKRNATAAYIVGDKCAFHCCSFQGSQSTLMVDEQRQFFRDCKISGSTSVIYGGATTVFQNCTIFVHQPSGKKDNIISIQGRRSNLTAGFIFHSCRMLSSDNSDLVLGYTFIPSPAGMYSQVVVMRTYLARLINPVGSVIQNNSLVFYAEYQNIGPGAVPSRRLHYPGIKVLSHDKASNFSLKHILEYDVQWVDSTGIPYWDDLVSFLCGVITWITNSWKKNLVDIGENSRIDCICQGAVDIKAWKEKGQLYSFS